MNSCVSVVIPAHRNTTHICECLLAVLRSGPLPEGWRLELIVIVEPNSGKASALRHRFEQAATARGWSFQVLLQSSGRDLSPLNQGDAAACGDVRIYLDADAIVSPPLVGEMVRYLDTTAPRYASGNPRIAPTQDRLTMAYGRFWAQLPNAQRSVPNIGVFAVNKAGRNRWGAFPSTLSDDTFVRLQFSPPERIKTPASFSCMIAEGFSNLVRIRRRQEAGDKDIAARYPELLKNDDRAKIAKRQLFKRFLIDPTGFGAYATVAIAVKTPLYRTRAKWVSDQ